ncbi:MAG: 1-deoxy-D-xylulose-5-phosphate reductoisomerase [Candidatus Moranbacteria bacterium]|nr:1-deoxy-D-xylulose-5-phosphate reductoisomerase [Candidatus Moranbacteria bacterium]
MEHLSSDQKKIVILGSTGSIGKQTLEIVREFPNLFKVIGLSANTNFPQILKQIQEFKPQSVAMMEKSATMKVKQRLKLLGQGYKNIKVNYGLEALCDLAKMEEANIVITSVVGSIGIKPTLEAGKAGKRIGLANKETLVSAGEIIKKNLKKSQSQIIPVDSEHSAIFQCLMGEKKENLEKIILTCSGGPFKDTPAIKLKNITAKEALNHPTWSMGGKISIDSSTLMNKGLEVIEAHHLFDIDYKKIEVLVHSQSLIHSFVELKDGSLKAQISEPSMKIPIQLALTYPERLKNPTIKKMPWKKLNKMTFEKPDLNKFPCLKYAYEAGMIGGSLPAVINATNEIAVDYFLKNKIKYPDISQTIRKMMEKHKLIKSPGLEDILEIDRETKIKTKEMLDKKY